MLRDQYKKFHNNPYIVKFGQMVSAKDLWQFNRESVAKGIALGVACAWIPLPFHTVIAVFFAILIDCNIPLVAVSIWFANPVTMPFMYFFAYHVGANILGVHSEVMHFHLTIQDVILALHQIWQPFLLGCLVCALVSWLIAYLSIHLIWPNLHQSFKDGKW